MVVRVSEDYSAVVRRKLQLIGQLRPVAAA